jgi:HK97 family phage major capsid protein
MSLSAAEKLAQTIKTLEKHAKDHGGKIEGFEQALTDLKTDLKAVKQAQDAANRAPVGEQVDVHRGYCVAEANRGQVRGGVADLRKAEKVSASRSRWVGSGGGVVRMLGGIERGRWAPGLLDDPAPKSDWQREAQQRAEEIAWVKAFKGEASSDLWQGFAEHMKAGPPMVAKVFADNTGEGGEFIVTIPMTMLERTAELERQIESLIQTIDVPSSSVTMPFLTTGVQPFLHGVPVAGDNNPGQLPKSVPTTAERTLSVKTLAVNVPVDREAAEDSIIAAIPLMQRLAGEGLRDGSEDCLINGDTAATHGDTAFATWNPRSRWQVLGSSADHRRAWIGFRQRAWDVDATVTTAAQDYNTTQTIADYIAALASLTSPHGLGDVVYITSPEHYLRKIITDTNVLTVDKYGDKATVLTGEVARIGNHPLVLSEFVTSDLATTGLYTGSGATTGMLIVNLARFVMARRRAMRIEVETVIRENTVHIVASERKTLHTFDGASTANVRWLYNLTA